MVTRAGRRWGTVGEVAGWGEGTMGDNINDEGKVDFGRDEGPNAGDTEVEASELRR